MLDQNTCSEMKNSPSLKHLQDCFEIGKEGMPTGVYTLAPEDEEFDALCDSDTDGGGWTVIQRFAHFLDFFLRHPTCLTRTICH